MSPLEEFFDKACADGIIPGAVLMAANKDGSFNYTRTFGVRSLETEEPMELDTFMRIYSCTKLMTSIAALQCIERGQIKLESDVAELLPELASLGVLAGFEESGEPIIKKRKNVITLGHLLTHAAGTPYEAMSPDLIRYRQYRGEGIGEGSTIIERGNGPLTYEPGTSWSYGTSIDWAGKLVERLAGMTLEEYMKKYIWGPLGITSITFWRDEHPELKAKAADMSSRDPAGSGKVVHGAAGLANDDGAKDCFGGQGASASMLDYFKILHSILVDDEKLLRKETTKTMFEPQLSEQSKKAMRNILTNSELSAYFIGEMPTHIGLDWGIGGLLTRDDDEGWRKKNTLMWSGMPNLFWFIDREAGLCGLYGGQIFPPGDRHAGEMITLFEKTMYENISSAKAKI